MKRQFNTKAIESKPRWNDMERGAKQIGDVNSRDRIRTLKKHILFSMIDLVIDMGSMSGITY